MKNPMTPSTRFAKLGAGLLATSMSVWSAGALAMNGAQLGGYGIKSAGMGGASIALPLDPSAAANNPAGMAFVPSSFTQNLVVFKGQSTVSIFNSPFDDNSTVIAPEGGANWVLSPTMTVGLTGSGSGAGVDFGKPLPFLGKGNLTASQKVLEVIPSVTWKVQPDLALGLGVIFAWQQVNLQGSPFPDHGTQTATGIGARLGMQWNASPEFSLGATYKMKTLMGKLGEYGDAGNAFAYSDGKLDLPAEYGLGVAWKASPAVTLAADYVVIQYGDVKANQDPNGPGWKDQPVMRLGVSWEVNPTWTLRGGYSSNKLQIDGSRTAQNMLTPAVNDRSYTFGVSMKIDTVSDVSFSLEDNPAATLNDTGATPGPVSSITSKTQVMRIGYQRAF